VHDLINLIGKTPFPEIKKNIFAKLEFRNQGGSIKDRAAFAMVQKAEKSGELDSSKVIVEASSGNFGISLAMIGAVKNYRVKICLPENFSPERQKILTAFGAETILTSAEDGMLGAIARAHEIAAEENAWVPNQFENSANPEIHFATTGPEIFRQLPEIRIFVAGVGTGGTISGVGRFLKNKNSTIRIVAVEPAESPVLAGGQKNSHKIEGIGAGFIPKNFDAKIVDEIIQISSNEAIKISRELAKQGWLVGISSAANFAAAQILSQKFPDQKIVTIFPDGGERYLSTELFR